MQLEQIQNDMFTISGIAVETLSFVFKIMTSGVVKQTLIYTYDNGEKDINQSLKKTLGLKQTNRRLFNIHSEKTIIHF